MIQIMFDCNNKKITAQATNLAVIFLITSSGSDRLSVCPLYVYIIYLFDRYVKHFLQAVGRIQNLPDCCIFQPRNNYALRITNYALK